MESVNALNINFIHRITLRPSVAFLRHFPSQIELAYAASRCGVTPPKSQTCAIVQDRQGGTCRAMLHCLLCRDPKRCTQTNDSLIELTDCYSNFSAVGRAPFVSGTSLLAWSFCSHPTLSLSFLPIESCSFLLVVWITVGYDEIAEAHASKRNLRFAHIIFMTRCCGFWHVVQISHCLNDGPCSSPYLSRFPNIKVYTA